MGLAALLSVGTHPWPIGPPPSTTNPVKPLLRGNKEANRCRTQVARCSAA